MFVPKTKLRLIGDYKQMKRVFLPEVSLDRLPSSFSTAIQKSDNSDENVIKIEDDEEEEEDEEEVNYLSCLQMVQCDIDDTPELNEDSNNTVSDSVNSHFHSIAEALPSEPSTSKAVNSNQSDSVFPQNFNPNDYKISQLYGKPTKEEKELILSKILKKKANAVQKNGSWYCYKCTICDKKFLTHSGAFQHIFIYHIRKQPEKNPYQNDVNLTPEEHDFLRKNMIIRRRDIKFTGTCRICNKLFKGRQQCKEHILRDHLNKNLAEIFTEPMIWKLSKKGKVKGGYNCVICQRYGNEAVFKFKSEIIMHLRNHPKDELRFIANDLNQNDANFDHPFALL
jgi:hypothetical protein